MWIRTASAVPTSVAATCCTATAGSKSSRMTLTRPYTHARGTGVRKESVLDAKPQDREPRETALHARPLTCGADRQQTTDRKPKRPVRVRRQADRPPARHRPGVRSARRERWPFHNIADRLGGESGGLRHPARQTP